MIVIPVIDLHNGIVVHARCGQRDAYQRLRSPLCPDGDVLPLVRNLNEMFGFLDLYIADLDAIMGRGDNRELITTINRLFPTIRLWVDGGFASVGAVQRFTSAVTARAVVGTESWMENRPPPRDSILSIDQHRGQYRDPAGLVPLPPDTLPADLILMNLDRVGGDHGPDLTMLNQWQNKAPVQRCFLAGGIRHSDDLIAAADAGADGVLIASALHDGRISLADIQRLN